MPPVARAEPQAQLNPAQLPQDEPVSPIRQSPQRQGNLAGVQPLAPVTGSPNPDRQTGNLPTFRLTGRQSLGNFTLPVTNGQAGSPNGNNLHDYFPADENKGLPALPVQTKPDDCTDTKNDCTGKLPDDCTGKPDRQAMPVQTFDAGQADCPDFDGWRQKAGEPPMPRSFSGVPHLKLDDRVVGTTDGKLAVLTQTVTGWQIQWSVRCTSSSCQNLDRHGKINRRYRPVAGFVRPRAWRKMEKLNVNQQQQIIETLLRRRFDAGRISSRHPGCPA